MKKNLRYNSQEGYPILGAINKIDRLFQVPVGYFDGLPEAIMAKIRLDSVSKDMGFQVPDGYFAGLASQIMTKIHADQQINDQKEPVLKTQTADRQEVEEELQAVAPFLLQISRKDVYSVPEHYFESLDPLQANKKASISNQTEEPTGAKVVPLHSRNSIWRTAVAAAAVVLVLFSGQRFFSNQHKHGDQLPESTGTQFAAKIYTNTDSEEAGSTTIGLEQLSDEEILSYLNTVDPSSANDSIDEILTEETQKAISNMTSEELESYLERTPATY